MILTSSSLSRFQIKSGIKIIIYVNFRSYVIITATSITIVIVIRTSIYICSFVIISEIIVEINII